MTTYHYARYIYWIPQSQIEPIKLRLKTQGYVFSSRLGSQCEVLKTQDKALGYATPHVFNRLCKRQGAWYRDSHKNGFHLIVADHKLVNEEIANYLNAAMFESDFVPENLPTQQQLVELVNDPRYQTQRPDEWEQPGIKDRLMFKTMLTLTGFWGWGDNLKSTWLNHRANHANFLTKKHTTEIDGESVAYTVSENSNVCSSCVEFFNLVSPKQRKLIRGCPGSITLAGIKRDQYYDIKPVGSVSSYS